MASEEPLLLQGPCRGKGSFVSISNQKVYCLKMMEYFFNHYIYVTFSSGYFIMVRDSGEASTIFTRGPNIKRK